MKLKEQSQSTVSVLAGTSGRKLPGTSCHPCIHASRQRHETPHSKDRHRAGAMHPCTGNSA